MEAVMRARSLASLTLATSGLVFLYALPADAQIEFAKSTIRFKSAQDEPTEAVENNVPAQPMAIEQPPAIATFSERHTASRLDAPIAPPRQVHTSIEIPRSPVVTHQIRQASYEEPVVTPQQVRSPMPNRAPTRVGVYSGTSAQTTLSKLPSPAPVQPKPSGLPAHPRGKPFQSVASEPAISPYMNLYRSDRDGSAPLNYMTLVRPQLDQIQASRQQAAELQKLRGQLQNLSAGPSGGMQSPRMGSSARYMDTAQFYGKMHR